MVPSEILIADDDEIARDVMAQVLTERGHAVTLAGDGVRAIDALRRRRFAVAVLDYHMPLLDGATAAARIAADPSLASDTRLIGVTADPAGLEMRSAGGVFDAIVQKPLNLRCFVGVVEACLGELRTAAIEREILGSWRACGFERRPRARFAGEPAREILGPLGRAFDLTKPGNPDVVLITEGVQPPELEELRTDGNLFALPMVDVSGRWGDQADAVFDLDDRTGWDAVAAAAMGFAARRARLTDRFLMAGTLPDKLLAYVFASGRDFSPILADADEWTPAYRGFFPVRRVRIVAEQLAFGGLLSRTAARGDDEFPFAPPRFALTPTAIARLTGDLAEDAFPRRRLG